MPGTQQPSTLPPDRRRLFRRRLADLAGCAIAILVTALLLGAMVVQLLDRARVAEEARRLNLIAFDEAWELVRAGSDLSDYRWTDGVLLPYRIRTEVVGIEQVMTVEGVEHNVDLDTALFRIPPELDVSAP